MDLHKVKIVISWLLLVVTVLFILSGYGITNYQAVEKITFGILTKANSFKLHSFLAIPFIVILILHVSLRLKQVLKIKK